MQRIEAEKLIRQLIPEVERESAFLNPSSGYVISAMTVFDVIREASDPPITKKEFNAIADSVT